MGAEREPLIGPLFAWELRWQARQGWSHLLRMAAGGLSLSVFVLLLIAAAQAGTPWPFEIAGDLFAHLATTYARLSLLLLAPAFLFATFFLISNAPHELHRRRALEPILATPMSDRELAVGLVLPRLASLLGAALTVLPLFLVIYCLDGVDERWLGLSLALVAGYFLGTVGISCWSAVRDIVGLVLLFVAFFASLFTFFRLLFWSIEVAEEVKAWPVILAAAGEAGIGILAIGFAARHYRTIAMQVLERPAKSPTPKQTSRWSKWASPPAISPPPVGDDALAWKERYFRDHGPGTPSQQSGDYPLTFAACGFFLSAVLLVPMAWSPPPTIRSTAEAAFWVFALFSGLFVGAVWCLVSAVDAAWSIGVERERRTLDGLLSLPNDRSEVLHAKRTAALRQSARFVLPWMIGVVVLTLPIGGPHPLAVPMFVGWCYALARGTTSFGLWLSIRCQSPRRATAWTVAIVLAVGIGPWMTAEQTRILMPGLAAQPLLDCLSDLSPVGAGRIVCFPLHEDHGPRPTPLPERLGWGLASTGLWLTASFVFWRLAVRAFEREGKT